MQSVYTEYRGVQRSTLLQTCSEARRTWMETRMETRMPHTCSLGSRRVECRIDLNAAFTNRLAFINRLAFTNRSAFTNRLVGVDTQCSWLRALTMVCACPWNQQCLLSQATQCTHKQHNAHTKAKSAPAITNNNTCPCVFVCSQKLPFDSGT